MGTQRAYHIKEVAIAAGVSVRTLHYYDQIGLLRPSGRTEAGYRLYGEADLLRLQQVLIQREFGMPLEEIRRSLDDPRHDLREALAEQRSRLLERQKNTEAMVAAVDRALSILDNDNRRQEMVDEIKTLFDGFNQAEYEGEARERWGETDALKESTRRARSYGALDWEAIKLEQAEVYADAHRLLDAQVSPESGEAMEVAERHRLSIDRWFYPCNVAMHRGLADLWESDKRFQANIDRFGEGLTRYLAAAVRANAAQHEGGR